MKTMKNLKSLLTTLAICLMAAFITSCGESNTPTGVTKQILNCAMEKDFEGYVKLMNIPDNERQQTVDMMKKASETKKGDQDSFTDYEIISEEIDEASGIAHVRYKLIYDNGKEEEGKMAFEKVDGKWMMSVKVW